MYYLKRKRRKKKRKKVRQCLTIPLLYCIANNSDTVFIPEYILNKSHIYFVNHECVCEIYVYFNNKLN